MFLSGVRLNQVVENKQDQQQKPMDETETEKFRTQLLCLKTELLDLEENSKESTRPVELDQTRVGRLSRMDAMQAQEMAPC